MFRQYAVIWVDQDRARHCVEVWATSGVAVVGFVLEAHPEAQSVYVAHCA